MKIEFDETSLESIYTALQVIPQTQRDMLAVSLMQDYLERGAHFYNDFARALSAACIFPDKP